MITDDLKSLIYDWFQFREVNDETRFPIYFKRQLSQDYERYSQLLRVEPGVSHYDWLVTEYSEALTERTGTGGTTESTTEATESERTGGVTITYNTTNASTESGTRSESGTTGRETSGTNTRTDNTQQTTSRTTSNDGTDTTTGSTKTESEGGTASVSKEMPHSISYSGATAGNIPSLDWTYPGGQSQSKNDQTTTGTSSNKVVRTGSGTESTTAKQTGTVTTATEGDESGTHSTSGQDSRTGQQTHTGTDTHSTTENGTGSRTQSRTAESQSADSVKDRRTGRHQSIAALLEEAKGFIVTTNAWEWLKGRLEVCFLGVYEYEH